MAKRNAGVNKPEVEEVEETETPEVETKGSVTVTWSGGSRVYSKAVHGKDFRDLAKEFVKKHNGELA